MRWWFAIALLLAAKVSFAASAKVIVLDLRAPEGPARQAAAALDPVLASEVGHAAGIAAVTQADLRTLLAGDALQQLLGCDGDAKCASAPVGATGAAKLVSGEVQLLETTYVLSLTIIDVATARAERRATRTHAGGAAGLIPELRSAVEELLGGYGFKANAAPVAAAHATGPAEAEEPVGLDATGSYDPDGQPLTYRWRQLAGPAAAVAQPSQAVTSAILPEGGRYAFGVTVSDGQLESPESVVELVARAAPKIALEAGAAALFGLPALAAGDKAYRERVLQNFDATLLVPLTRGTSLTIGGTVSHLFTQPETGADDADLSFIGLSARAGVRRMWTLGLLRAGAGIEGIVGRGYFDATVHAAEGDREDGWHRTLLVGGGAHALAEVPLGGGFALVARAGVRYFREVGGTFEFDRSFVPFRLNRAGGVLGLVGFDTGLALAHAW